MDGWMDGRMAHDEAKCSTQAKFLTSETQILFCLYVLYCGFVGLVVKKNDVGV